MKRPLVLPKSGEIDPDLQKLIWVVVHLELFCHF